MQILNSAEVRQILNVIKKIAHGLLSYSPKFGGQLSKRFSNL
jgi:hypothetical protein